MVLCECLSLEVVFRCRFCHDPVGPPPEFCCSHRRPVPSETRHQTWRQQSPAASPQLLCRQLQPSPRRECCQPRRRECCQPRRRECCQPRRCRSRQCCQPRRRECCHPRRCRSRQCGPPPPRRKRRQCRDQTTSWW